MAIENAKLLNVRIKNKYDSYENWVKSNLTLEPGEIAIAYTEVDVKVDNGTAKHPALLMKVGNGKDKFADLPWLSAKAADVLSVCKNENDLKTFINNVIADAGIATDDALTALAGRVTTAEGAIDALEALVGSTSVQAQISSAIAALNLADTYAAKKHEHVKADITDFDHSHEMSEINGLAAEFAKYQEAGDYSVEGHKHEIADVNGLVDALAGKETAGEAAKVQGNLDNYIASNNAAVALKADKTSLETEINRAKAAEEANTALITAIKNGKTLDSFADVELALEGYQVSGDFADAEHTHVIAEVEDLQDALDAKANQTALQAEIERAKAAEKSNADAIALLTNGVDAEVVDGVNDLIAYVVEHGAEVTGMKADIAANAKAIEDHLKVDHDFAAADATLKSELEAEIAKKADASVVTAMDAAYKAADEALDARLDKLEEIDHDAYKAADTALKTELNAEIAKKADKTTVEALDDRVEVLEGKAHEHANFDLLETYTQTEANLADAVAKKHAHANATVLDGISAEKVAAWDVAEQNAKKYVDDMKISETYATKDELDTAKTDLTTEINKKANDADLAAIAKSGSTDDLVQGTMILVFDCGTSAE